MYYALQKQHLYRCMLGTYNTTTKASIHMLPVCLHDLIIQLEQPVSEQRQRQPRVKQTCFTPCPSKRNMIRAGPPPATSTPLLPLLQSILSGLACKQALPDHRPPTAKPTGIMFVTTLLQRFIMIILASVTIQASCRESRCPMLPS